jgi:hypothetical protein
MPLENNKYRVITMGSFGMINRKMTKVLLLLGSFLASQAYALGLGQYYAAIKS